MTVMPAAARQGALAAAILLFIGLAVSYQSFIAAKPERLTELYFTGKAYKPLTTEPGIPFPVSFTVRNAEHRTTDYAYTVTAQASAKKYVLHKGSIRLRDSHSRATTIQLTSPTPKQRTNITVQLQYAGMPRGSDTPITEVQHIHFWINNAKGGSL